VVSVEDGSVVAHYTEFNYHYGTPAKSWKSVTKYVRTGLGTSYGMNADTIDLNGEGRKILALDYLHVAARTTDDWSQTDWDRNSDGRPDFCLHHTRINVLRVDGTVGLMSRGAADPVLSSVAAEHWEP
jgi:hypothetical protein